MAGRLRQIKPRLSLTFPLENISEAHATSDTSPLEKVHAPGEAAAVEVRSTKPTGASWVRG